MTPEEHRVHVDRLIECARNRTPVVIDGQERYVRVDIFTVPEPFPEPIYMSLNVRSIVFPPASLSFEPMTYEQANHAWLRGLPVRDKDGLLWERVEYVYGDGMMTVGSPNRVSQYRPIADFTLDSWKMP